MSTSQFRNRPHFPLHLLAPYLIIICRCYSLKKKTRSKKTCRFYTTSLHITDFTILLLLAPANFVLFRGATLISLTGNHCAPPVGIGVSTTRLRRLCRLGIARLRRFRVTRLCRCRVRLRRSRSSRLRITGLYRRNGSGRRSGSRRRNRRNRCRICRRHGSTVAGTAVFISLVAGRDLLRPVSYTHLRAHET